jgi:hypothetical protein
MLTPHKQAVMRNAQDMIELTAAKIEKDGNDYIMLLCDLTTSAGKAVASLSGEFDPEADINLWIYALEKEHFVKMAMNAGMTDAKERVKPKDLQLVLFSEGAPHWFTIERADKRHWAQFSKNDFRPN